jgi:flagellar hook-associated protein 2
LTELKSQYEYVTDDSAREKQDATWASQLESYQEKIETATQNIDDLLNWSGDDEDATNNWTLQDYVIKNADGTYAIKDDYLKTDDEGNTVIDTDKLPESLTAETLQSKLDELNTNVSTINSSQEAKEALEAKQTEYQGLLATDPDGSGLKTQIESIQAEIESNKTYMDDTYDFTSTSTDLTDLKDRLNKYAVDYFGADANSATDNGLILSDSLQSVYDGYKTTYTNEKQTAQATLDDLTAQALSASGLSDDEIAALSDDEKNQILNDYAAAGGFNQSGKGAVRVTGSDAEIVLNGATFTSTTNSFSINGLTITATAEMDEGEEVTISTSTDIDGIYDSIKKMLSGFNDVLTEMNTLYYADSSKGYEPLTDDEKDAMTDTEIEKWETKIKDSLLRRDSTLGNIMTVMKNSMAKSYTINGKSYSLSTFGISTSGYFSASEEERGTYHIDGDADDSTSSGNSDKLKAMLATDPDTVITFFQKLSDDLYSTLTKKMASTSLSSAYTIYNDKQMQTQYDEYDDKIDEWDDRIDTYTERYVKQFSAMETALASLNSSSSALSGLLS